MVNCVAIGWYSTTTLIILGSVQRVICESSNLQNTILCLRKLVLVVISPVHSPVHGPVQSPESRFCSIPPENKFGGEVGVLACGSVPLPINH